MQRVIFVGIVALAAASQASAQQIRDFGFAAGVVGSTSVHTAPLLSAHVTAIAAERPFELALTSSVAELSRERGARRDLQLSVLRIWRLGATSLHYGAGIGLHAVRTRVEGAAADASLAELESSRSGLRPALAGMVGIDVALAPRDAAALRFALRGAALDSGTQLSLGFGIKLAPRRGGLLFGERTQPPARQNHTTRSWDAIVAEVMALENRLASLDDVLATPATLVMTFFPNDRIQLRADIAYIARILSGSSETLQLTISAPQPDDVAAAAAAAGFPADRIETVVVERAITLQATRPVTATRSVRR